MKKPSCAGRLTEHFNGCLYFSAGRLYRAVERLAFEAFRPVNLAPTQAFLLMGLGEMASLGATPSELAGALNLDRSTVTRLLVSLEKSQLVKSQIDGRFRRIQLTVKGRDLIPEIKRCWQTLYTLYSSEIGEQKASAINTSILKNFSTERGGA